MDRNDWLQQQRQETERGYDKLWAPLYGEKWGAYPNAVHMQFIEKILGLFPEPGTILDAACGAGRYMPALLEKGHSITGIDQAQGMLDQAKGKFPGVHLEKVGLQEFSFSNRFDGAICIDALDHYYPLMTQVRDWLGQTGFEILEEGEGNGYHHFLTGKS